MNQLDLHTKIEQHLEKGPQGSSIEDARALISVNSDARNFFYSTASEKWIEWLWQHGLLDAIKQPAADSTRLSYRMPELDYLVRMSTVVPEKVTEIMLLVKISKDTLNPEVIDRFLWIAGSLPAEQLKLLAPKIRDEQWVSLMHIFSRSGYEFERMIKKLVEVGDEETVLTIAEAILIVRTKEEIAEKGNGVTADNPFYLNDIGHSEIFASLVNISEKYAERVLKITTAILSKIVETSDREPQGDVFKFADAFYLFDVDFFELELDGKRHLSYRDDVRDLVAVLALMIKKTIGKSCKSPNKARRLLNTYILGLPDSRAMWRLRLFALSLCPETFKVELKEAFFKIFTTVRYHEIESGTEYKKALNIGFGVLPREEKREYIARILEYFNKRSISDPDQDWHKRHGWEILSSICKHLTKKEKRLCELYFDRKCDPAFKPEPEIGKIHESGLIQHKSPVNLKDYSIDEIITKLKNEWSPAALKEKYGDDDFFQPRGTEGLADMLKVDLRERTADYLENAIRFFDREKIHPHYTYSYLRGIEEMLRDESIPSVSSFGKVLDLFDVIRASGVVMPFDREDNKDGRSWLVRWTAVHDGMGDILLQLLTAKNDKFLNFDADRQRIFDIIQYMLTVNDPISEHEKPEYGDLFHIAINSVRGRAFQVFTEFIFYDGKKFEKNDEIKIRDDVKTLYESLIENEKSMAVRFVMGHYLGPFYFRDKKWFENQWQNMFSSEPEKKDYYLAMWEGYLNSTLYVDLFHSLRRYYDRAIDLTDKDYVERNHTKSLDELLAVHIALAFAHFPDFNFDDQLFKKFWNTPNAKRQTEFILFLGRHCLSRGNQWLEENEVSKDKLMMFWDWLLKQENINPEVFSGFGMWVNQESEVLDFGWLAEKMAETMKRAKGQMDWDYGLMQQLPKLAKTSARQTLKIIEYYLLNDDILNVHRSGWIHIDRELRQALDFLYANQETRDDVYNLINKLIEIGGSQFWGLKEVIKQNTER
jgi:hypothetical protein